MIAALLAFALVPAAPPADELAVAWLREGRVETRGARAASAPLGSLWKLFVYAHAVDRGLDTPDYACAARRQPGEEYCCEPGGHIARDRALARSCGLFFAPARLKVEAAAWRAYWQGRAGPEAAWLLDLGRLKPETRLTPAQVLHALQAVPEGARRAAAQALLPVVVETDGVARHLGGSLRVKTFTWDHPARPGASLGGGAGWLVDGTPVWFADAGSSRQVLQKDAARLAAWLPAARDAALDEPCVAVEYFERYPIAAVDKLPAKSPAAAGPLLGEHRVLFANGNALTFRSAGELHLEREGGTLHVRGRLPLAEYLARVLDREADPGVTEAARALAVVARSWMRQNAPFEEGCYQVADSTRMQRVSPSPASAAARAVVAFTAGLVLDAPVRYRREGAAPGVLAWTDAVRLAQAGQGYQAILAGAFPRATLAAESGESECRRLAAVESWLQKAEPRWRRRLAAQPGFEEPEQPLTVCALDHGNPYAERERLRVHVRGLTSVEDRITLAHEYVHLAFRFHPSGADEALVERLARTLAEE